jgi:NAD(P)-dependent dehydrogenase (short-subunit alcohol dehydrogenase family)
MNFAITGASKGIGNALYHYYTSKGNKVIGVSRSGPDIWADLSFDHGIRFAMSSFLEKSLFYDVLINNAGILLLDENDLEQSFKMLSLNLVAVWRLTEEFINRGVLSEKAVIINVSSVSGMRPDPDTPLYGATKAGVISLTQSYASKLKWTGKRVVCISPGFFNTQLVPGTLPSYLFDTIPAQRVADPKELCSVVDMILDTPYLNGVNIPVEGGILL